MTARTIVVVWSAIALALLAAPAAIACPKASLPDIEDEVMCPVCGTSLDVAGAPQADRQRAYIQDLIDKCQTKAQIKTALVAQFGDSVLALPRNRGFNAAAYVVPIASIALAFGALLLTLPRWRRRARIAAGAPASEQPTLTDAEARRLDEDLARFDG